MKQSNIFKPTLKFSRKRVYRNSNVNVSNDNFRLSQAGTPSTRQLQEPVLHK